MQQSDLFGGTHAAVHQDVHRLFFALVPDRATGQRMHDAAMALKAVHAPRGRWIGQHRYHLTLQFVGDFAQLPQSTVDDACAAASTVRTPAFTLQLDRAGSFRNRSVPWWLSCDPATPGLVALWERLGLALAKAGVKVHSGKTLTPHITVLRDAGRPLPETKIPPFDWPVDSFTLIHSLPGAQNVYTPLGTWPLKG